MSESRARVPAPDPGSAAYQWWKAGAEAEAAARDEGLNASVRELRQLREENRKLKGLVADLSLDRHVLQEIVRKKL